MSFSPADLAKQVDIADPEDIDSVMTEADRALAGLAGLTGMPTAEHVAVFEDVQQALADTLTAVDEA